MHSVARGFPTRLDCSRIPLGKNSYQTSPNSECDGWDRRRSCKNCFGSVDIYILLKKNSKSKLREGTIFGKRVSSQSSHTSFVDRMLSRSIRAVGCTSLLQLTSLHSDQKSVDVRWIETSADVARMSKASSPSALEAESRSNRIGTLS